LFKQRILVEISFLTFETHGEILNGLGNGQKIPLNGHQKWSKKSILEKMMEHFGCALTILSKCLRELMFVELKTGKRLE